MIHISAPYPQILTTSIFPNPELEDTEALTLVVQFHRAMDGTRFSYTKKPGTRTYNLSFIMTRKKALELFEFWRSYAADDWRINLHDGRLLVGKVTTNPLELTNFRRAPYAVGQSQESQEICDVQFDFQGIVTTPSTVVEDTLEPVEESEVEP